MYEKSSLMILILQITSDLRKSVVVIVHRRFELNLFGQQSLQLLQPVKELPAVVNFKFCCDFNFQPEPKFHRNYLQNKTPNILKIQIDSATSFHYLTHL